MAPTVSAINHSTKLFGRAFYESLGSPTIILAPMVDQSEWAWRMLTRSFLPTDSSSKLLAYTPMIHSRLLIEAQPYRDHHFEPLRAQLPLPFDERRDSILQSSEHYLDGNPKCDRPLFVQFCANSPETLLQAARHVEPFCDAVDLNLGCPQGIAKKGHYGAFLQEDWNLIYQMINKLHRELQIPVTAKMRILETKEKTLDYAKMILSAGASIITVHGRRREQKGHLTGLADWSVLRYLRDNLPPETVIFANGNVLQHGDIQRCLDATGADAVMSAEGNLSDPSIFASPPPFGQEGREYWRGRDGKGGYRVDAVFRRYLDILHRHVLHLEPPQRQPLFVPSDLPPGNWQRSRDSSQEDNMEGQGTAATKQRSRKRKGQVSINLRVVQPHLFNLLRQLVSVRTDIRDALSKCRTGDIEDYEQVLTMVEAAVKQGLMDYEQSAEQNHPLILATQEMQDSPYSAKDPTTSSEAAIARCRMPWWVCQSHVRPLPAEAIEKGAITLSKKDKLKVDKDRSLARAVGLNPDGATNIQQLNSETKETVELPKEGLVCG